MARIRTIKPEFPHSESMGKVTRDARLAFILMWTLADDSGRLRGNSRMLASLLFPYDDDAPSLMEGWLAELERQACIDRYIVDGTTCVQIRNWLTHQKIDKPSPSKLPPFAESSRILANPRERSSGDQGSGPGSRIKDQGRDQGPTDRAAEQPRVRSKAGKDSTAEPPEFAEIRKAYPRRAGSQRWGDAVKHYRKRIAEGVTHDAILAGVTRYARFLEATGKAGTETVQQAATFLGDNRGYLEPWNAPTQTQQPRPLSTVERVRQANGVHRDDRVVAEQRNGSSFDDLDLLGGDVRQPLHAGIRRLGS